MTYRTHFIHGLGASTPAPGTNPYQIAAYQTPGKLAPPSAEMQQQTMLDIVPYSCAALRLDDALATPQGAAPGRAVVMAWPYVTLDDAGVQAALDNIYGGGAGGKGLVDATSQAIIDHLIPGPPTFVASGWMRDTGANQATTRGTLWMGFGFATAVDATAVRKFGMLVLSRAIGWPLAANGDGLMPYASIGGKNLRPPIGVGGGNTGTIPKATADASLSDNSLQMAAVRSAAANVGFHAALATVFSGSPLSRSIALTQTTRQFNDAATKVTAALEAHGSVSSLIAAAAAAAPAARDAGPGEACTTAVAALDATTQALEGAKGAIRAGIDAAEWLSQYVQSETNPDGGKIVKAIRDQVVEAVNGAITSDTMGVTKEYMKCIYFVNAKRSLDAQLKSIAAKFAEAQSKAGAIQANSSALAADMAAIDTQITANGLARGQSCLPWYLKDMGGLPTYAWLAGGTVVLVGGAVTVKTLRKRRAAAAAPKPNRRRTSKRHRRTSRRPS